MFRLSVNNLCITVSCDRTPDAMEKLATEMQEFYPYTRNRIGTEYKISPSFLPEILHKFRYIDEANIDSSGLPQNVKDQFWDEWHARHHTASLMKYGPKGNPVVNANLTLEPHQQLGREIAQVQDRWCFFYDTRTGKTPLSLTIIYDDLVAHPDHRWLVVCPLILIENAWLDDLKKFFPNDEIMTYINCHDTTKAKRIAKINTSVRIYITNTESFVNYAEYFKDFDGLILDESSSMKSPRSSFSKQFVTYSQGVDRVYLLSGTPAPNGEYEYYMQMRCVDYYGWHSSYSQFKQEYFINTSYNPQFENLLLIESKREQFTEKIRKRAHYVDKVDVLDLPGRTFHEWEFDMPDDLKAQYRSMKNSMAVELGDDRVITAVHAGAKFNKLNQLTSGFIMDTQAMLDNQDFGTKLPECHWFSEYRFDELMRLLDLKCVDKQAIIWAHYRKEFDIIKARLGNTCVVVNGGTTIADKNIALAKFKSGAVQFLLANPASADKGLTLTNAHIEIYFSLNASYELFKQSCDRIYASKKIQPEHCHYYIMIARGTIDGVIYRDVLGGKSDLSYAVLNHLKGTDNGISAIAEDSSSY